MTNREKYGEEILDFLCKNGWCPALVNGGFASCEDVDCRKCEFGDFVPCRKEFAKWLNSEYVEPEIDWRKVPIDTKVLVKDGEYHEWIKRYFAGVAPSGKPMVFLDGKTSWTKTESGCWDYIKLADPEDIEKYAKKPEDSK